VSWLFQGASFSRLIGASHLFSIANLLPQNPTKASAHSISAMKAKIFSILICLECYPITTTGAIKGDNYSDNAFELPPLPYPANALEPFIKRKTLEIHHGKHHAKYVNALNTLVKGNPEFDSTADLKELMLASRDSNPAVFNNAAQSWNHEFYWHCMTPDHDDPPDSLDDALQESFGSFEEFKKQFAEAGNSAFGSGWAWLVYDTTKETLFVMNTIGADNPYAMNETWHPILTMDVWEHAYYLDYQNRRPSYTSKFLEKLVNWEYVAGNLQDIIGGGEDDNDDDSEDESDAYDDSEDDDEPEAEL
jgi:Fe-Mn family superoxide dismutase